MKSLSWILTIVLLSLLIQSGKFFIIESAVIGAVGLISYTFQCKFFECCDDYYINRNTPGKYFLFKNVLTYSLIIN